MAYGYYDDDLDLFDEGGPIDYLDFYDDLDDLGFGGLSLGRTRTSRGGASATTHSKETLQALYQKAKTYARTKSNTMRPCPLMYRDKTKSYFDDIIFNKGHIMKVYTKDYHGDPKSPSNGRIDGLFFSVNVDRGTGRPPRTSIYGERRLIMSTSRIFDICPNVYFTDFYCVKQKAHYVTLVMTKTGSTSDDFCRQNLITFEMDDNPFFRRHGGTNYQITDAVWVEVLVTENIDIKQEIQTGAHWENAVMKGKRSGGNTGLAKCTYCGYCNI